MKDSDILSLYEVRSDRDKQTRIGASDMSDPCTRCLAEKIARGLWDDPPAELTVSYPPHPYVMGANIGTAIHADLERRTHDAGFDWQTEQRFKVGELEGYGPVYSTADAYDPADGTIVDYKTTTKAKLKELKYVFQGGEVPHDDSAYLKFVAYTAQTHLYALGKERQGGAVNAIKIVFVPRDASLLSDVFIATLDYDRTYAEKVWGRSQKIVRALLKGRVQFKSTPGCYYCTFVRAS